MFGAMPAHELDRIAGGVFRAARAAELDPGQEALRQAFQQEQACQGAQTGQERKSDRPYESEVHLSIPPFLVCIDSIGPDESRRHESDVTT